MQSAEIEVVLAEENANALGPGFAPGGVRLQVPEADAERAEKILGGGSEEFTPLPDDFVPPEGISEEVESVPPRVEGFGKVRELIPAGLCILAALGVVYAVFLFLAPLTWTHSSAELVHMGIAASHNQDYAKALKYYDAALIVNPRSSAARFDRGLVFSKMKNYGQAIADFTQAIQFTEVWKKSQAAQGYRTRGLAYKRMGNYDKALEDYNKAIDLDPGSYVAYDYRGFLYSRMGDSERAIDDFERVIRMAPEKPIGYNGMAWMYATCPKAEARNGAKALELATKACELSEWKDGIYIDTLAAAEAETGNFDDAVKHAQQALAMVQANKPVDARMVEEMTDALLAYQQKRPYRDVKR